MSKLLAGSIAFVTGATGFFGGGLVHRLVAEGARVKALARDVSKAGYIRDLPHVEIVTGDITDAERMKDLIRGTNFVFHAAAAIRGKLALQKHVNVDGTRNVAQAAGYHGVTRFVHISTIGVYGYTYRDVVNENMPHLPGKVAYNLTKSLAETEVLKVADKTRLQFSIMRPGFIYGPRSGAWTTSIYQLAQRSPTPFIGNGNGTAHPIFVDDAVDMAIMLATAHGAVGEAYNCVHPERITWREFVGYYQKLAHTEHWLALPSLAIQSLAPFISLMGDFAGSSKDAIDLVSWIESNLIYTMDKARRVLGWQPQTSMARGMAHSAAYLIEQGLL